MKEEYKNLFGTWSVTTEGDVEGRSVKQLGTYIGYVDEIALHLADKCYYSLEFTKEKTVTKYTPKRKSVSVRFNIESKTWNKGSLKPIQEAFRGRPVNISDSNYYSAFLITTDNFDEEQVKKAKALEKLSDEEKKLLNLT